MCSCPGDCEGAPECLDDEGGPLDFAALAELADRIGYVPRRELRCHPNVCRWLMLTLPEAQPEFPFAGVIGSLTGITVVEKADLEPGAWELREDGDVKASGHIEVPPWVTEPVRLDVALPRMIDRSHSWFPYTSPSPIAMLGSVI